MILPTKRLSASQSLLAVGAELLRLLYVPKTGSGLWHEIKQERNTKPNAPLSYDWFILALDFLYALNGVELESGRLRRARHDSSNL